MDYCQDFTTRRRWQRGMGVGDINGDGRMDIVAPSGWWEQPPKGIKQDTWTFHPEKFGSGGAEIGVFDVNGDGLNDVVTSIAAHGWGLAWFRRSGMGYNHLFAP